MSDAILYVGYEESTGAVISVGGVTVLGLRGSYAPPIISARRIAESDDPATMNQLDGGTSHQARGFRHAILNQQQSAQTTRASNMPLRAPAQEIPIFPPTTPQSHLQRPANSPLRATNAIPTHSMFDYRMR